MERGRDPSRYDERDSHYGGETYRPAERGGRSPPRVNTYRGARSPPPRRGRTPPPDDGYSGRGGARDDDRIPSRSVRRRSRSPTLRRAGEDGYRGRARTPPRGYDRPYSPLPRRRRSKSPYTRERSPPRQRRREPTPPSSFRQRSPPMKPSRYVDERDDYDRRGYLPRDPRDEPRRFPRENNYRPRERSRSPLRRSAHASGGATPTSSRRSSGGAPPMHPDRMRVDDRASPYPPPRQEAPPRRRYSREQSPPPHRVSGPPSPLRDDLAWRDRSPPPRARSPPPRARSPLARARSPLPRAHSPPLRTRSPPLRPRSPSLRDPDVPRNGITPSGWSNTHTSSSVYHSDRAHHNGPSASSRYDGYPRDHGAPSSPPSAPVSMSAHSRSAPGSSILSAPTRPRGSGPTYGRDPRDPRDPPPYASSRGARFGPSGPSAAHSPTSSIPTGPRGSGSGRGGGDAYDHHNGPPPRYERGGGHHAPPFRGSSSSSTTYPRTAHFGTSNSIGSSGGGSRAGTTARSHHLAGLPSPVEGGKRLPSVLDLERERRLAQLEEDRRKLVEAIEEKQRAKRAGLREWERVEREGKREALKSELAEGHLERLGGEVGGAGGAY